MLSPLPADVPGGVELPLVRDPFVLATPAGSDLARMAEPLDLKVLHDHAIILLEEPHCLRGHALALCNEIGAHPDAAIHATSLSAAVQMIRRGLGATLLPALCIEVEAQGFSEIALKPFASPPPSRTIGLVWRGGSARAAEFRLFGGLLMDHLAGVLRGDGSVS